MENYLLNSHRFNLAEYQRSAIENLQDEGNGYLTGKFYDQPVLLRYLGDYDEHLSLLIEKYSCIDHKTLTINYGVICKKESNDKFIEKVHIIRELIESFKNFYFITNFEYHNKLIIIYQIICLFEYLHSFDIFYKYLKPQKIFIFEDIKVKILNLIQADTFQPNDIINGSLNDDLRFFCPDLYNPSILDSIGCHLFYESITNSLEEL
jgi:hypothetical protein